MKKSIQYLLVSIAFGCGPGPAPKTADSSTSSGQGSTEGDSGSDLEPQRQRFVDGCMQKAQSREYCACGFEQFKIVFKDADLSKPLKADDPRFASVRDKTGANCASKLNPAQIEQSFVNTCVAGDERRNAYCLCAWTSLSKSMTPAAIVSTDTEGPQFLAAKKTMVVACKGKFPDDAAKTEFMTGCVQEQTQAACTCLWKKLKAAFTTEEIVAGTVDVSTAPGLSECK